MTLTDIASIGSLASGVAVLVSLLFVGVQVMQNTRAIRAQIHQNITDGWIGVCAICADHGRSFAEGLAADDKSFAAMPDDEKLIYMSTVFAFFKHYENMFLQHREGFVREEDWNAWISHMFMYWRMPGVQTWWKVRREAFSPDFRRFIETSPPPAMPSQVDFFTQITSRSERVD